MKITHRYNSKTVKSKWDDKLDSDMLANLAGKHSTDEIAKIMRKKVSMIKRKATYHGISLRVKKMPSTMEG